MIDSLVYDVYRLMCPLYSIIDRRFIAPKTIEYYYSILYKLQFYSTAYNANGARGYCQNCTMKKNLSEKFEIVKN